MAQSKTELEELKAMESHSAERRTERKKVLSSPPPGSAPAAAEEPSAPNPMLQDLVTQVEEIAKEMETVAKERPAIAVLAAFATGIAVGHLMARR